MCVVLCSIPAASSKVMGQRLQSSETQCELSVFEELQDFHAQPIVDSGNHYRLVKSYRQGMKEHHHVGTCRQGHQVCTGLIDGLEASAADHVLIDCSLFISSLLNPGSKLLQQSSLVETNAWTIAVQVSVERDPRMTRN